MQPDGMTEMTTRKAVEDQFALVKDQIMNKTLKNSTVPGSGVTDNVPDVVKIGNPDDFVLLFKAYSDKEGWMKSTKALQVPNGCIVQTTTQQLDQRDGRNSITDALVFVPGVKIESDRDSNHGHKLVSL